MNVWFRQRMGMCLGALVLASPLASAAPQDAPGVDPSVPSVPAIEDEARPVRSLTEGPLHEGFLSPSKATEVEHLDKAPPPPITERPGVDRPAADAQWIEGYWDWDNHRNDFTWVTGTWRVPPPGRFWVNGYWKRDADGWFRVPGFWSDRKTDRLDFRKSGPPADHPEDEPGPSPGNEYFYVPGQYFPDGDGVKWKAGFWAKAQPGWSWVPAQWVKQPEGWTFQEGYWDRTLEDRGTLFAPANVDPNARNPNTVYQPYSQVGPQSYGMLYGAFGRPNSYYDGYPGCYYDPNGRYYGYAQYGYLGNYYGYLDYPFYGSLGYPYMTSPVYGGGYVAGYPSYGGFATCGLLGLGMGVSGGLYSSLYGLGGMGYYGGYGYPYGYGYGLGMMGYGYPYYGYGYGLGMGYGYGLGMMGYGYGLGMGFGYPYYGYGFGGLGLGFGLGYGLGFGLGLGFPYWGYGGYGYGYGYPYYGGGYGRYGNGYGYGYGRHYAHHYPFYPGGGGHRPWMNNGHGNMNGWNGGRFANANLNNNVRWTTQRSVNGGGMVRHVGGTTPGSMVRHAGLQAPPSSRPYGNPFMAHNAHPGTGAGGGVGTGAVHHAVGAGGANWSSAYNGVRPTSLHHGATNLGGLNHNVGHVGNAGGLPFNGGGRNLGVNTGAVVHHGGGVGGGAAHLGANGGNPFVHGNAGLNANLGRSPQVFHGGGGNLGHGSALSPANGLTTHPMGGMNNLSQVRGGMPQFHAGGLPSGAHMGNNLNFGTPHMGNNFSAAHLGNTGFSHLGGGFTGMPRASVGAGGFHAGSFGGGMPHMGGGMNMGHMGGGMSMGHMGGGMSMGHMGGGMSMGHMGGGGHGGGGHR